MSTNETADDEELKTLFVEVTGDDAVTAEQEGTDRREAVEGPDRLAGRTEKQGLSSAIEAPDEAL